MVSFCKRACRILGYATALIGVIGAGISIRDGFGDTERVTLIKTPEGGLQPQAVVDSTGVLHLVFFKGNPEAGDLFYVRQKSGERGFSHPIRVNSQPGSAITVGTIRGAQIALGKDRRIHVVWNGSGKAQPKTLGPQGLAPLMDSPNSGSPMLYTYLNDTGTAFEPQRNLMRRTLGLDGGGTIASDLAGNVYVAWHAVGLSRGARPRAPTEFLDEVHRRVWIAHSGDNGKTFSWEVPASSNLKGACACCGMRGLVDGRGTLYLLYRSATERIHRDTYLLVSQDKGRSFKSFQLHPWEINACPMSSFALAQEPKEVLAAWETKGQIYFTRIQPETLRISRPISLPGPGGNRKHPAIAVNNREEFILVWTEGTGWGRGGDLVWQVFNQFGQPTIREDG